jgi:uncharacterized protein involved in exopolysaccharide biosynthesis
MDHSPESKVPRIHASDDEEITLVEIANTVLRHWRLVVAIPVLFALGVSLWTLVEDRTYVASAWLLPQTTDSRLTPGAAALAQQLGVNVGAERAGQSPQFYVDLLSSRAVLQKAVEAEYEIREPDGTSRRGNLIDFFETTERAGQSSPVKKAMDELADNITTSITRESGLIRVRVNAEHPGLAEQIAGRLLDILHAVNLEVRRSRALEEGRFIGERVADARSELDAAEASLQAFLRQNRDFSHSPDLRFEHDRLQRQVVMRQEVYTALLRSQEQARIDGVRDTPAFAVIDHPEGSAEPLRRGLAVRIVIALMLGLMVSVFAAFIRESNRRRRETGDPQFMEFRGLAQQAWEDLRHPGRWVRSEKKSVAVGDH